MFAKAVLQSEQRGVRPAQAYARVEDCVERWKAGDKAGLWKEVMEEDGRRRDKRQRVGGMGKDEREQRVNKMAGLGRVSGQHAGGPKEISSQISGTKCISPPRT
eukprot:5236214-Karenia_brevis.AAC.1